MVCVMVASSPNLVQRTSSTVRNKLFCVLTVSLFFCFQEIAKTRTVALPSATTVVFAPQARHEVGERAPCFFQKVLPHNNQYRVKKRDLRTLLRRFLAVELVHPSLFLLRLPNPQLFLLSQNKKLSTSDRRSRSKTHQAIQSKTQML